MSAWFRASDLAGLPGIPTTRQGVKHVAEKQAWRSRPASGRGGGLEYHAASLPMETRLALGATAASARHPDAAPEPETPCPREAGLAAAPLDGAAAHRADARLAILQAFDDFIAASGLPINKGSEAFAKRYTDGAIAPAPWVRETVPSLTGKTLRRWRTVLKRNGAAALAGRYGRHRKGAGRIDGNPPLLAFLTGLLTEKPHANAKHAIQALRARFDRADLPSYRTLQRWISDYRRDNAATVMAVANPDGWKNRYMAAFGDAGEKTAALNQLWELDSTPGDVLLADGRHAIVGAIDVWSRRLKLHVSRTSKSSAIAALLRRALIDWGVPAAIKTDNGADYTSRHITRVVKGLDIRQDLCAPFAPWEKPHIERALGTFNHGLVELLDGYIGHSVADRQAIESRRAFADRLMRPGAAVELTMTAVQLQAFCDRWCESVYAHAPHAGLGGASPFERAAEWRGPLRRIENERALDVLLAAAPGDSYRAVTRKGIRVDGIVYIAPELEEYIGRRVAVRYDETDIGRLYVFDADGDGFICIAEAPEVTGVDRRTVANEARRRQRHRVSAERKRLREAARRERIGDIAEEILEAAERDAARVVAFPKVAEAHESEGLDAAADAARARFEPDIIRELTPEQRAVADELYDALQAPAASAPAPVIAMAANGRPHFETDADAARWIMNNPELADDYDRAWLDERLESRSFRLLLMGGAEKQSRGA